MVGTNEQRVADALQLIPARGSLTLPRAGYVCRYVEELERRGLAAVERRGGATDADQLWIISLTELGRAERAKVRDG
jgi:hypothetical protein